MLVLSFSLKPETLLEGARHAAIVSRLGFRSDLHERRTGCEPGAERPQDVPRHRFRGQPQPTPAATWGGGSQRRHGGTRLEAASDTGSVAWVEQMQALGASAPLGAMAWRIDCDLQRAGQKPSLLVSGAEQVGSQFTICGLNHEHVRGRLSWRRFDAVYLDNTETSSGASRSSRRESRRGIRS